MTLTLRRGPLAAVLGLLFAVTFGALAHADPTFLALNGRRVVDDANVLAPAAEQQLTSQLQALEQDTGRQMVVATIPSLQDYDIADYGYRLGRAWGIGTRGRNDGVILLVAPNERKVRIEVGYGLEGVLTDALTGRILREQVVPRFRANDIAGGVTAGAGAVIAQLRADPDVQQRNVQAAATSGRRSGGGFPIGAIIVGIFLVWLLVTILGGRRRRSGGLGGVIPGIIIGSALGRGGGGWGGGGGWSGGGGGGFSGGGGSFGGGGSSSGW